MHGEFENTSDTIGQRLNRLLLAICDTCRKLHVHAGEMTVPSGTLARISAAAFIAMGWTGIAAAAPAAAIFPFEIFDTSGEAPQPDLTERLAMATRVLSEALEKTGRYSPVDLGPFGAEVAATSPRYHCGNCFLPVARQARRRVRDRAGGSQGVVADLVDGHLDTRRFQRRRCRASRRPDPRRHF